MGKNVGGSSWLNAVIKAFGSPTNKQDNEREQLDEKRRAKRRWIFSKPTIYITTIQHNEANNVTATTSAQTLAKGPISDVDSNQSHAIALAMATTAAAEAAIVTAQAAVQVIRLVTPRSSPIAKKYYISAIIIQTIFRGYLARRAFKALKGIVKMQALVRGYNVRKRAKMTLQCIQSLVRVQDRVRDQRRRLSCGSSSLRESHPPTGKSIYCSRTGTVENEWDAHQYTSQEMKAMLQKTKEATPKRSFTISSPVTPFPSNAKAPQVHSACPTSAASVPNFMAATASAKARFRSQSAPRQRRMSPDRDRR